jgi:hypothetical protein
MAKGSTTNLAEQNAERAMYAANHGMDWMREIAERSLNQSRTMFEEFLTTGRTTVDIIDRQASEVRERSMSLAAETISNTFDFAHKIIRMREPQELIQLQTEFISRQAQALAEQSKDLEQSIVQAAKEMGKTTSRTIAEASRRGLRPRERNVPQFKIRCPQHWDGAEQLSSSLPHGTGQARWI